MADLLIGNDQLLTVQGLTDVIQGDIIPNATVTVTITTLAGVPITVSGSPPVPTPIVMQPSGSSPPDGNYVCILEDDLPLVHGQSYYLYVHVDAGADLIGLWRLTRKASYRSA